MPERAETTIDPALGALIGIWRTEGAVFGEDGETVVQTFSGTDSYRRLGDHFVVHDVDVVMGDELTRSIEVIGPYDEQRGAYRTTVFEGDNGQVEHATAEVDESGIWTFHAGSGASRGRATLRQIGEGRMRGEWVRTEDDGATWRPWMRLTLTRT